jgi:hypothetical protein
MNNDNTNRRLKNIESSMIIPYVRIGQIIEFVESMPNSETSFDEIYRSFKLRKSQMKNIIPSLVALGLLKKHKGSIELTKIGQDLRLSIKTNNEKESKNIIKNLIQKVAPLSYIVELLNQEQKITIEQIGRRLAIKYNKSWDHPLTYKTHGASCASIVAFAGYGIYDGGVLRKSELLSAPLKIPFPNVTFQKMVKILENIYPFPNISIKDLSQKIGTSEGRLSSELIVCNELKLIEREYRGIYKISEVGEKLISPSLREEDKSKIFKQCFLNSRYKLVIEKLSNVTFDVNRLGEIIIYIFRSKSTIQTQKIYGMKFLNWLKNAQIVKKVNGSEYTLDRSRINEAPILREINEKAIHHIDADEQYKLLQNYYEIGKLIGMFLGGIDKKEIKTEEVEKLIIECHDFKQTEDVVALLTEHKNLFETLNDPRIFLADVKLLDKIIGGGK